MPTVEELRKSFSSKSTEQLLEIIRTPKDWSEEAVEAASQCLNENGTEIPASTPQSQTPLNTCYANLFDRFIATIIDLFIKSISLTIIAFILFWSKPDAIMTFIILVSIPVDWLYSALQESSNRMATIGQRTMKIKVLDSNQNRISFAKATGRYFAKYLSSILFIGFIMALFTKKHQALHDLISGSVLYSE